MNFFFECVSKIDDYLEGLSPSPVGLYIKAVALACVGRAEQALSIVESAAASDLTYELSKRFDSLSNSIKASGG